jgi:ribosomal protein S18 acetylase RimI-like enzyme
MEIHVPDTDAADSLVDLWLALASDQRAHGSRLLVEENAQKIRKSILYHIVNDSLLVAVEDDIVGFVMFSVEDGGYEQDRRRGLIENLYVRPERRNDGVGSALIDAAESRLHDREVEAIALEVLVENERAREFYSKHGYDTHRLELEKSVTDGLSPAKRD